jgi:hypothetical protein
MVAGGYWLRQAIFAAVVTTFTVTALLIVWVI